MAPAFRCQDAYYDGTTGGLVAGETLKTSRAGVCAFQFGFFFRVEGTVGGVGPVATADQL
jgi:hypothetical protein